ncbi:D-amino-acid transaminase [Breoghania sp.]|uniref:D-amino-acid transaminase n=1 Tax=Breoghania sp. TaxID=2065378 RepID=UPI002606CD36|nr:D-amino-acid transaminase [Breoghania sp.]MDJ0932524.1 D-amino-acid transaminase [Breoghania sp.]
MRTVYVNGNYVPEEEATVSVFDRGFLFADAIYEVTSILDGNLIDFDGHMKRLHRSLNELKMPFYMKDADLMAIHRELVSRNAITEGLVYLQISRGAADRDFIFPAASVPPTVVLFTQEKELIDNALAKRGQKVITVDDLRWRRCDIKTVQLLWASIVKNEAKVKGADDAWMVRDGFVTEGSSNNAYIVEGDGTIVTRSFSYDILSGITRTAVLKCAGEIGAKVEERSFTVDEAKVATEAFSTSATGFVNPVVEIDGVKIGTGVPGPVVTRLREIYTETSRAVAV